jgi:hypothetical protein
MDGGFHLAVEDWFQYGGRTFDTSCYEICNKVYRTWEETWSTRDIEHQLSHSKNKDECELCRS